MPRVFPSRHRFRSALGLLLEMALITVAVFLGLLADEWREERQQEALAKRTLERFRVEVAANSAAIEGVLDYHRGLLLRVSQFVASTSPKSYLSFAIQTQFKGIQPVSFEHSAWDLAVATGSLGFLDPELAFAISKTYTAQAKLEQEQQTFSQSSFTPATFSAPDFTGFGLTMQAYLTDVTTLEPKILELHAALAEDLDKAVGAAAPALESSSQNPPAP